MIVRLKVTNWKKFSSSFECIFDKGIQLLYGSNTTGKSSLLDAIRFAFFGVDEKTEDIPTHDPNQETIVELDFIGIDSNLYRIIRGYKKINRKTESFNLYKIVNGTEDFVSNDSEEAISLFGSPPDIFSHIVFLKEGEIYRALNSSKNNLGSELSDVLNLGRFDLLHDKLSYTRLKYVQRLKKSAKKTGLILSDSEKDKLSKAIKEFEEQLKEKSSEKKKLNDLVKVAEDKKELKKRVLTFEDKQKQFGETIKDIRTKFSSQSNIGKFLLSEIEKIDSQKTGLDKSFDELHKKKSLFELEKEKLEERISEIEKLESSNEPTCPTCYQKVNPAILKEVIESFEKKKEEQVTNIAVTISDIDELNAKLETINAQLNSYSNDKKELEEAQDNIGAIQDQINVLQEQFSDFPEIKDIEIYDAEIQEIDTSIIEIAAKKGEFDYKLKKSEEGGIDIEQLEFQEKFINLIEIKVKEHKREVLEQRLNEVKSIIKDKWSEVWKKDIWSIDFDKDFIPILKFKGNEQTLRGLSGSEKIMLSVIMRAALLEKIMDVKTLILDDPSIFLDTHNLQSAASFYQELIKQNHLSQIILTSFDEEFKNYLKADNVIILD